MGPEKLFENRIKTFLKDEGVFYFKTLGSAATKAGLPDIICCINGTFVGIEVKAANGRPSILQKEIIKQINANNGVAVVIYPKDFERLKGLVRALKHNQPLDTGDL